MSCKGLAAAAITVVLVSALLSWQENSSGVHKLDYRALDERWRLPPSVDWTTDAIGALRRQQQSLKELDYFRRTAFAHCRCSLWRNSSLYPDVCPSGTDHTLGALVLQGAPYG